MEVRAVGRFRRVAPSKARRVVDLLRSRPYEEARGMLRELASPTAHVVLKVLESAGANAEHNHEAKLEDCWVSRCWVDDAVRLKRWRFRARGRADRILRRCSHITIYLADGRAVEPRQVAQRGRR